MRKMFINLLYNKGVIELTQAPAFLKPTCANIHQAYKIRDSRCHVISCRTSRLTPPESYQRLPKKADDILFHQFTYLHQFNVCRVSK